MAVYYSPDKDGFFDTDLVDYPHLPQDCIEITKQERDSFIYEMNHNNKKLAIDNDKLVLVDRPIVVTWASVRNKRNSLLNKSDYTQVPDFPGNREAWSTYRQLLRDIPQTYSNPEQVIWPMPPK